MAKIIDGEIYLSPMEASQILGISHKTLERWAEAGSLPNRGSKNRARKKIALEVVRTATGYRYYKREGIQKLSQQLQNSTA